MKIYSYTQNLNVENSLIEALNISQNSPIIAFIGAGGKTSLINRLSRELILQGKTVIIATTTRIFENTNIKTLHTHVPTYLGLHLDNVRIPTINSITNKNDLVLEIKKELEQEGRIIVGEKVPGDKIGPSKIITIEELSKLCDYLLIEGDGARMLPIKAPGSNEPVIPKEAQLIIGVTGLDCISKKIQNTAFRPEIICDILSVNNETEITPKLVAELILHPMGQQKNLENRNFISILNKGDTPQDLERAIEVCKILNKNKVLSLITSFNSISVN